MDRQQNPSFQVYSDFHFSQVLFVAKNQFYHLRPNIYKLSSDQWSNPENMGIAPDIEQKISAIAVSKGRDLQLEKAVEETLKLLEKEPFPDVKRPAYSTPAKREN